MKAALGGETLTEELKQLLLGRLLESSGDGLVFLDCECTIVLANRWMENEFRAHMPLVGKKLSAVLDQDQAKTTDLNRLDILQDGLCIEIERRASDQGGEWLQLSTHKVEDADGNTIGAVAHLEDITERKRREETLTEQICRWRTMVEQSLDGIVMLDQNGHVREANQAFARMLGYSLDEVYNLWVWDWEAVSSKEEVLDMIDAVDSTGDHIETTHRRKDGTTYEVEISSNGAIFNGRKLVFCVCRDVTEKKAMQERIHQLAIRDPLTEIYNRRYIFERLDEMAAEYTRGGTDFSVSILDLDHFKMVNDAHGHLAGDFVLKEFAHTVSSAIRPYDLLGRYGGEEFVIVSRNVSWHETTAMIKRIMALVRTKSLLFDHQPIRMTFSCGVADSSEFANASFSVEHMVKLADDRLYMAKAGGRDLCIGPRDEARQTICS